MARCGWPGAGSGLGGGDISGEGAKELGAATKRDASFEFFLDPCRPGWHSWKRVVLRTYDPAGQKAGSKLWEVWSPAEADVRRVAYGVVPAGFQQAIVAEPLGDVAAIDIASGDDHRVGSDFVLAEIPDGRLLRVDGEVLTEAEFNHCGENRAAPGIGRRLSRRG